jgi:hypothetical protein
MFRAVFVSLIGALALPVLAQMTPVGVWRTYDDNSGELSSEVRISDNGGVLSGTIEKLLRKDVKQDDVCEKCTDARKGKPVLGLEIIRGAKKAEESRRARRRRDGCADRRPPGQRQGAGGAVRPARQGRPQERHRHQGHRGLKKLKPAPLGVAEDAVLIQQANYEEHLELAQGCDLIIEAIAERMDWKLDLYKKIAPYVAPHAIVASNTSGLSITKLSEALPEEIKPRFCGIHFFNPPRYMALVELINTPTTEPGSWTSWKPLSPAAWARAWCAPRTRPTSSPTASASPACWPP